MRYPVRYERDDSLSVACAAVGSRVRALPEFNEAQEIVIGRAVAVCRGLSVATMRAIGGFSCEIRRQIEALPDAYRVNHGSKMFPRTVVDELRAAVPEMREEVQTILARAYEVTT
jgi:hypothetical protein